MGRLARALWDDEGGDMIEDLGVMLIIGLGVGLLVAGLSVYLDTPGLNLEKFIQGVVRE